MSAPTETAPAPRLDEEPLDRTMPGGLALVDGVEPHEATAASPVIAEVASHEETRGEVYVAEAGQQAPRRDVLPSEATRAPSPREPEPRVYPPHHIVQDRPTVDGVQLLNTAAGDIRRQIERAYGVGDMYPIEPGSEAALDRLREHPNPRLAQHADRLAERRAALRAHDKLAVVVDGTIGIETGDAAPVPHAGLTAREAAVALNALGFRGKGRGDDLDTRRMSAAATTVLRNTGSR